MKKIKQTRQCVHCGKSFEATYQNHHSCSKRCQKQEKERRRRKRRRIEQGTDPTTFLRTQVPEPVEREGVPFPLTKRLPGSFEHGKRR